MFLWLLLLASHGWAESSSKGGLRFETLALNYPVRVVARPTTDATAEKKMNPTSEPTGKPGDFDEVEVVAALPEPGKEALLKVVVNRTFTSFVKITPQSKTYLFLSNQKLKTIQFFNQNGPPIEISKVALRRWDGEEVYDKHHDPDRIRLLLPEVDLGKFLISEGIDILNQLISHRLVDEEEELPFLKRWHTLFLDVLGEVKKNGDFSDASMQGLHSIVKELNREESQKCLTSLRRRGGTRIHTERFIAILEEFRARTTPKSTSK